MDFRELFRNVGHRRRMYLPDDRYASLVSFVEGCNAATEWRLLDGFNEWVSDRVLGRASSLHWSTVVASKLAPHMLDETHPDRAVPAGLERAVSEQLLDMIDAFLAGRQPPRASGADS
jgi:hypothetical protein